MDDKTTATIYDGDLDRIHDLKGRGESVADVVHEALDAYESCDKPASTA